MQRVNIAHDVPIKLSKNMTHIVMDVLSTQDSQTTIKTTETGNIVLLSH